MQKFYKRSLLVTLCASSVALAAPSSQVKIDALQHQLDSVQTALNQLQAQPTGKSQQKQAKKKAQAAELFDEHDFVNNYVAVAPYTGKATYNSGPTLIINAPSINMDAKLLYRRFYQENALLAAGEKISEHPRLVLSGEVAGGVGYERPYWGPQETDVDLTEAVLDTYAEVTPWVNGLMEFSYDRFPISITRPRRVSNSNLYLSKGFLTIGNFNKSPFYGTLGQNYIPFGRYSTNMIVDPVTKNLGATKARAITVGYEPVKDFTPTAHVFFFRGNSNEAGKGLARQMGFDVAFRVLQPIYNANVGASYIANIADANSMQNNGQLNPAQFQGFDVSNAEGLIHRVSGATIYGNASYGPFGAIAEVVTALQDFSPINVTYNGRGARPKAMNTELSYGFKAFEHPFNFAVGYGRTSQALAFNVPWQRYDASLSMSIMKNLFAEFEYQHNINYGATYMATAQGMTAFTASELGKTNDMARAQMALYF